MVILKGQMEYNEQVHILNSKKQHLLCFFTNSKINQEDPRDSGRNLSDLSFQTVRFSRGFSISL